MHLQRPEDGPVVPTESPIDIVAPDFKYNPKTMSGYCGIYLPLSVVVAYGMVAYQLLAR
jgi:hypothetical protein